MMTLEQAYKIVVECEDELYEAWQGYSDGESIIYTDQQYRQAKAVILCGEDESPALRIVR